jgi:Holliday junction resolvasome RuvABC endonuclease subunit
MPKPPSTVCGIDGGLDCLGIALVTATVKPEIVSIRRVETKNTSSDDARIRFIDDQVASILHEWLPDAIACEKFGFIGDRSKSYAAQRGGRAVHNIEGVCSSHANYERRNSGRHVPIILLTKQEVNEAIGLKRREAASKANVKTALERVLMTKLGGNYDERDALAVAIAAVPRLRVEMAKVRRSA